jgi:hypothetical protein
LSGTAAVNPARPCWRAMLPIRPTPCGSMWRTFLKLGRHALTIDGAIRPRLRDLAGCKPLPAALKGASAAPESLDDSASRSHRSAILTSCRTSWRTIRATSSRDSSPSIFLFRARRG